MVDAVSLGDFSMCSDRITYFICLRCSQLCGSGFFASGIDTPAFPTHVLHVVGLVAKEKMRGVRA